MKRLALLILVGVVCFAWGASNERRQTAQQPAAAVAVTAKAPVAAGAPQPKFEEEPLWAYGFDTVAKPTDTPTVVNPPTRKLRANEDPAEQTKPRHVTGSTASYSLVDVRDSGHVIDWFPGDHPPMPEVIKRGPVGMGEVTRGCASCHLPNGKGRPENAPVAGLPPAYFLRQMQDFRSGLRYTADPRKPNTSMMITVAASMSDAEIVDAMTYFTSMPYTPWTRVVESATVPKTKIVGNLFIPLERTPSEPINGRIIEMPEDESQSELVRNPHSGFVAYVPPGSIEHGKDLATTGGMRIEGSQVIAGRATACITCHGANLQGVESVPPIAGRSPSYLARQLWDIQQGTRNGSGVALMKAAIAHLTPQDIVAVAAYAASRPPR